jgi:hypothetical protein
LIVSAGALMGMISSLLVFQHGQSRIWFAMSRVRVLPAIFSNVHSPGFRRDHLYSILLRRMLHPEHPLLPQD